MDNETKKTEAQIAIETLAELATRCDIPKTAFDEEVLKEKKFEAETINRAGALSQLNYLSKLYGTNQLQKFIERIEGVIMDNARRGKTVQCSICDCTEFLDRCYVKNRQEYVCRQCHKDGKDA